MMARERKATRSTLSAYDADLRNFYAFLKGQQVEQTTLANIQEYLATQTHLSSATIARRLSSLRQFYAYLANRGITKENALPFIKVAHLKSSPLSSLSTIHVDRLWEGAKAWNEPEGKRLFALLQILQATDMAVKAIVSLPLSFIQLPSQAAHNPWDTLQEYLNIRPYFFVHGQESPWLFPSSSQKGHLTPQRFGQLLKELGLKIGIDPALISLSTVRRGLHHLNKL